jgi:glutaredoxin 3
LKNNLAITIYGKPNCQWCTAAKLFLDQRGQKYDYIDIMAGDISSDDLKHLTTVIAPGAKTVPIIIIDGHWIGGYEQLIGIFQ